CHFNIIDKFVLELQDPSTTPEKALQWLTSLCYSPEDYIIRDIEPVVIFRAYMRFIMKNLPNACVDGIWEEIIKRTVLYSLNFSDMQTEFLRVPRKCYPYIYNKVATGPEVITWLDRALCDKRKCINPYIRLELFRLLRIMRKWLHPHPTWKPMCVTFIDTMSEINPHHMYVSGGDDEVLFGFTDLWFIIKHNQNRIFIDYRDRMDTRFISHCIQLIGKFAVAAVFISDILEQISRLKHLCLFLIKLRKLVISDWAIVVPIRDQFRYIITSPLFRPYIVETICDLTSAIINSKVNDHNMACIMDLRDSIVQDLNVCTNICDLPRLLMSRQIQGPKPVHQHSLLLNNLTQMYKNVPMNRVFDSNTDVNHFNIINVSNSNDSYADDSDSDVSDSNDSDAEESDSDDNDFDDSDNDLDNGDFDNIDEKDKLINILGKI
ncbi:unnamed protein product, partial [Meganyctiphanes norvegica]